MVVEQKKKRVEFLSLNYQRKLKYLNGKRRAANKQGNNEWILVSSSFADK